MIYNSNNERSRVKILYYSTLEPINIIFFILYYNLWKE